MARERTPAPSVSTELELAAVAASLAGDVCAYTAAEAKLLARAKPVAGGLREAIRSLILAGGDPLGDCFVTLRSPEKRREDGAVYTPEALVRAMVAWAANEGSPSRVVDPGVGSGRYLAAAAAAFPHAALVACDIDPLALLMLRANAAVLGFVDRLDARLCEYRLLDLEPIDSPTLFIGNPPYVRHHKISVAAKDWFAAAASRLGFKASKLAGLHVHFFLRTRELATAGDFGAFLTSAEWLDVNYGSVLREMLGDGLGGASLHVFAADGMPFENAMTTGAITCFKVGRRPDEFVLKELTSLSELQDLSTGRRVPWEELRAYSRWSQLLREPKPVPEGMIPLGDLFRVHRGAVTGGNEIWIEGAYPGTLPAKLLVPTITKGRELMQSGGRLVTSANLRRTIVLPADLNSLTTDERAEVNAFLRWATKRGAKDTYTARQRFPWWSIKLRESAPIICSYMARRAPAFVRNAIGARHINIAHGLYPRVPMTARDLDAYADYLNAEVCVSAGRTYAGGLTKFEPKEVERILVPCLNRLHGAARSQGLDDGRVDRGHPVSS